MNAQQAVLQVVILRDGLLVGTEVLMPGSWSLGSGPQVELKLDDPSIDPVHAVLYFQNGRSAIQDNNSRAGVYVNGHRVRACEVRSVDEIAVGPFSLKTRVVSKQPVALKPSPSAEVAALLHEAPAAPIRPSPIAPPVAPVRAAAPRLAPASPAAPIRPPISPGMEATAPRATRRSTLDGDTVLSSRRAGSAAPQLRPMVPPQSRPVAPPPVPDELSHDSPTRTTQIPAELLAAAQGPGTRPVARMKKPGPPKLGPGGKGKPRLYFELYWGNIRKDARSFGPIAPKKPVTAAASDTAQLPLYGFSLPEEEFIVAESEGDGFKLFLPPGATVETQGNQPPRTDGNRRFLTLTKGSSAVLSEGEMSLVAYVAPPPEKFFVNPLKGMPWLALSTFVLLAGGFVSLLVNMPPPSEQPDFQASNLPPVAVKLIAPEPKKKEEAKKKVEAIKEKAKKEVPKEAPKKEAPKVAKKERTPPPQAEKAPPPETKALKALAKLSAAGPATNDVLAAIDKMGNGPGSKNAKNDFKLSGLVGKDPIANAGLGTFGLGGGGKGGRATKGLEMLNGRGSGGIGALGASGFGRGGKVGGTVARASSRNIAVQGTIDREAVAKTVNSHLQEVRACYERALLKEPGLAGKVVLEWTISTAGKVVTAKTKSSTLRNGEVEGCILRSLKTWKFPPAKGGGVIVSYPFLFNSVGY